jgi:hypothetical protein
VKARHHAKNFQEIAKESQTRCAEKTSEHKENRGCETLSDRWFENLETGSVRCALP